MGGVKKDHSVEAPAKHEQSIHGRHQNMGR